MSMYNKLNIKNIFWLCKKRYLIDDVKLDKNIRTKDEFIQLLQQYDNIMYPSTLSSFSKIYPYDEDFVEKLHTFDKHEAIVLGSIGCSVRVVWDILERNNPDEIKIIKLLLKNDIFPLKKFYNFKVGDVITYFTDIGIITKIQARGLVSIILCESRVVYEVFPWMLNICNENKYKSFLENFNFNTNNEIKILNQHTHEVGNVVYHSYHYIRENDICVITNIVNNFYNVLFKNGDVDQVFVSLHFDEEKSVNTTISKQKTECYGKYQFCLEKINSNFVNTINYETISLDLLNRLLDDLSFINSYVFQLKLLYNSKIRFYENILKQMKENNDSVSCKIKKLKSILSQEDIREIFPSYRTHMSIVLDIEVFILEFRSSLESMTSENIRSRLINAINNKENGLTSLIGRKNIVQEIVCILYTFHRSYKPFFNGFNNFMLMGSSGSGKTKIAHVISFVLSKSGLILKNTPRMTSRPDFISPYLGSTSHRTQSLLYQSLENILFIDEAYELNSHSQDYGTESLTEIVNFVDKFKSCMILIVSGYEDKMKQKFLGTNEGLSRRFPFKFVLENYSYEELSSILIKFISDDFEINDDISITLKNIVKTIYKNLNNQAGDMLNLSVLIKKEIYCLVICDNIDTTEIIMNAVNTFMKMKGIDEHICKK